MNVAFWERRYARGGNSGEGSRGAEAEWKADLVRAVVTANEVRSLLDYGAGDGYVAARLRLPPGCRYLGVEPSPSARALAVKAAPRLTFAAVPPPWRFDLALSMDVVFHLVGETDRRAYFAKLFEIAERLVLIYGTCDDRTGYAPHVLHHDWRALVPGAWEQVGTWDGRPDGFKQAWLFQRVRL